MPFAPDKRPSPIHDTGSRERPSTDRMRRSEHDPPKPTLRKNIFDVINRTRAKYVPNQATIARNNTGSNATSRLPGQRLTVVPSKTLSPSIYLHVYHVFKPASASRNSKDPSHRHTSATNYAPCDPQHRATPSSIIANLGHSDTPHDTGPRNCTATARHGTEFQDLKHATTKSIASDITNQPLADARTKRPPDTLSTRERQHCDIPEYRRPTTHVTHPDAYFTATAVYPHAVIMRKPPPAALIVTPHPFVAPASYTSPDTRRHAAHLPPSEPSHAHAATDPRDDRLA